MDGYPDEWRRNGALSLPARRDDLVGLAEKVGEAILRDPPGLVVCGSRGGYAYGKTLFPLRPVVKCDE